MDWEDRIAIDPNILGGKPVVKGTRVPVEVIIGTLASGVTVQEVCRQYRIEPEDLRAALAYAARLLSEETVHALPGR